jgi:hypothetical protein
MKLYAVESVDVRGLANGVYSFAKGPAEVHDRVLVTGASGAGKTRLFEAIVGARELLATHSEGFEHSTLIRAGNETSKVIISWLLTPEDQAAIGAARPVITTEVIFGADQPEEVDSRSVFLFERYGHDDATPKLEYFSEKRRLDLGGGNASIDEYAQAPLRASITPTPRKFSCLPAFLELLPDAPEKAARFAASLARFSDSCAYDTTRHVFTSRGRVLRSPRELSASEADAVMFSSTATLVGLSGSIVLVDRPDLFGIAAPRALAGLAGLGEKNQVIMATPSPAFTTAFDGAIIRLEAQRGSG